MKTRTDGWPVCPSCGMDEVYCLKSPACICVEMACYFCGWRGDPELYAAHRQATDMAVDVMARHQARMRNTT